MADLKKRKGRRDSPKSETSSGDDSDESSESSSSNSSSSSSSSSSSDNDGTKNSTDVKSGKSDQLRSRDNVREKEEGNKTYKHAKRKGKLIDYDSQKKKRKKDLSYSNKEGNLSDNGDRTYSKGSKKYSQNEHYMKHSEKRQLEHYGSGRPQGRYEQDSRRGYHYNEKYERGHRNKYMSKRDAIKRDNSREGVDRSRYKKDEIDDKYPERKQRSEQYRDDKRRYHQRGSHRESRRSESEERRAKHVREWDRGKSNDGHHEEERRHRERVDENKKGKDASEQQKEEPNFELSGKLTEFTNTYKGVVIKYNEPPEARKTKIKWRIYPFKGDESLPILYIHRQSAYLLGRNRMIADIPIDHPSCSSQHAVIQFRLVDYEKPDGAIGKRVRPYIIDLESSNGTFVNNNKIEPRRYVELKEKDVLKFGFSSREYVLLRDQPQNDLPVDADKE